MKSPHRKPMLLWLVVGIVVSGCMVAWIVHRHTENQRRDESIFARETLRLTIESAVKEGNAAFLDRLLTESPDAPVELPQMLTRSIHWGLPEVVDVILKHGCNPNGDHPIGAPLV